MAWISRTVTSVPAAPIRRYRPRRSAWRAPPHRAGAGHAPRHGVAHAAQRLEVGGCGGRRVAARSTSARGDLAFGAGRRDGREIDARRRGQRAHGGHGARGRPRHRRRRGVVPARAAASVGCAEWCRPRRRYRLRRLRANSTRGAPTAMRSPGAPNTLEQCVPARGDGISMTALAVSTETSGWSVMTWSPSVTCQATISASGRPSPRSGRSEGGSSLELQDARGRPPRMRRSSGM